MIVNGEVTLARTPYFVGLNQVESQFLTCQIERMIRAVEVGFGFGFLFSTVLRFAFSSLCAY